MGLAMKSVYQKEQEDRLLQFLLGLIESFAVVRGQILMMNPLPPVNKAYALVLQEEKQREICNVRTSMETTTMSVNKS